MSYNKHLINQAKSVWENLDLGRVCTDLTTFLDVKLNRGKHQLNPFRETRAHLYSEKPQGSLRNCTGIFK